MGTSASAVVHMRTRFVTVADWMPMPTDFMPVFQAQAVQVAVCLNAKLVRRTAETQRVGRY